MGSWVIYSRPKPSANVRLLAFPHAGGGSGSFRNWVAVLGAEIELGYVQLPGRESRFREKPFSSMSELIPALVDAIATDLDRPFAFYGHSLGGKVAFEAARELRRRGMPEPEHLFVAACAAPQLPWPLPLIHGLDTPQFIDEIQKRYDGIPQQVLEEEELRALLLPMLRADITMIETYSYSAEPPLSSGITVFGGREDRMVEEPSLTPWREQTKGKFRLQMEAGSHFFPQSVQTRLPESITDELSRVLRASWSL